MVRSGGRGRHKSPAGAGLVFGVRPVLGRPRVSTLKISHASRLGTRKAPTGAGASPGSQTEAAAFRPTRIPGLSADARQAGTVATGRAPVHTAAGSLAQAQSCYDVRFWPDYVRLYEAFAVKVDLICVA